MLVAAQADRILEQPAAVRIERDARLGKRSASAVTAAISSSPRITPPLSLKSLKP
jgi:hypothetical protein